MIRALAVLIAGTSALTAQSEPSGVVLEMVGEWTIDGKPLAAKAKVFVGQIIASTGSAQGLVRIAYFDGHSTVCDAAAFESCTKHQVRGLPIAAAPLRERWMKAIASLFENSPRLVAAMSRGDNQPDQIATLGRDLVTFRKAPGIEPGQWQIWPLDQNGEVASGGKPALASFAGGLTVRVSLKPGIYQVNLLNSSQRPSGTSFWLLALSDPARVETAQSELLDLTGKWPAEDEAARRQLIRMLLLASKAGN